MVRVESIKPVSHIAPVFKFGASHRKVHSGFYINLAAKKLDRNSLRDYLSIYINYRIIDNDPYFKPTNREKLLPLIMLEGGIQTAGNIGDYAGVFRLFIEPKIRIGAKNSVGLRYNGIRPISVGLDDEQFLVREETPTGASHEWLAKNQLSRTQNLTFTIHQYIKNPYGWHFIAVGAGGVRRKELGGFEGIEQVQGLPFPEFGPEEIKRFCFHLGAGIKAGLYRISLEYLNNGKDIPNALSLQMGLEFGLLQ